MNMELGIRLAMRLGIDNKSETNKRGKRLSMGMVQKIKER